MPCPHNEISIVQRSQQQSAVAAAAYQSGEKLFCGYDQEVKPTATLGGGQMKVTVFMIIVGIIFLCIFVGLLTLIVRALLKYIHSKDVRQEKSVVRKSLGEALKVHRTQCKMTQEFVAETIGVSRQAVSKWENGTSDPSTSNLFALAKLYGISVEELLKEVE